MIGLTMSPWMQQFLVFVLVAGCLGAVLIGVIRSLRGRSSSIGRCCAKGCAAAPIPANPQGSARGVAFLPAESLAIRARHKEGVKATDSFT
jgi:hypothetical protein